jgi:hypothetical protein
LPAARYATPSSHLLSVGGSPPFLSSSLRGAGHNHAIRLDSRALRFRRHGFGRSDCTVEEEATLLPAWTYPAWRPGTPTRRSRAPACKPVSYPEVSASSEAALWRSQPAHGSVGANPPATHGGTSVAAAALLTPEPVAGSRCIVCRRGRCFHRPRRFGRNVYSCTTAGCPAIPTMPPP